MSEAVLETESGIIAIALEVYANYIREMTKDCNTKDTTLETRVLTMAIKYRNLENLELIEGGELLGEMDDLEYFRQNLMRGLQRPEPSDELISLIKKSSPEVQALFGKVVNDRSK